MMRIHTPAIAAAATCLCATGALSLAGPPTADDVPVPARLAAAGERVAAVARDAITNARANPADAGAWRHLAEVFHANSYYDEAQACYDQAHALGQNDARLWHLLAHVRHKRGDSEGALAAIGEAVRMAPAYAYAPWRRGTWLLELGRIDEAEADFRAALDIDPEHVGARFGLAQVHLRRREPEEAIEIIQGGLLDGHNGDYAHTLLASAYRLAGRMDEAAAEAARGRGARPAWPDPWVNALHVHNTDYVTEMNRVLVMMEKNEHERVLEVTAELRKHYPQDPLILEYRASTLWQLGRRGEASHAWREAILLDPTNEQPHLSFARHLARSAQPGDRLFAGALHQVTKAIELNPNLAESHELLGSLLARVGQIDGAIEALRTAADLDPTNAVALGKLGELYVMRGRYKQAIEILERTIRLAPDASAGHMLLARAAIETGDLARAREAIEQAERLLSPNAALADLRSRLAALTSAEDVTPQRPEFEAIADRLTQGSNPFLGHAQAPALEARLDDPDLTRDESILAHAKLAEHLIRLGRNRDAAEHVERALALAQERGAVPPDLYRLRGQVYLRLAEVENCVERHNAECCIFPLAGGGVHDNREPALKAKESYLAYLARERTLSGAWLLNVISMALGEYPEGVPDRYTIPMIPAPSQSADVPRFRDIAPQLGVDDLSLCGGCIVRDFDGDGLLDIVASSYDPHEPLRLYHNVGDGTFEDRSHASRLDDQLGGLNIVGADYDNDGDSDILVLRGAWLFDDGRIRNSLLRNNGDGTFTDVTRRAGLADPPMPTQTGVWLDYDSDGDLDLYIGNESRAEWEENTGDYPSQLFRNNGDGTFTDVAPQAGVTNDRYCKGAAAGDYDNDGDMDLYVSNIGKNRLYRNNGDGTFTDVAPELGVTHPEVRGFASWFFDYNNDGWLDIFAAAFQADVGDLAADRLGISYDAAFPSLYRNNGDGTFMDVAKQTGLHHPYLPMGANFGDINCDGRLDIYLGTGDPGYETLMPNVMLRNSDGKTFENVTVATGLGHLQKGHGVAFADIDNDGDQDIFHQLGGFYPGDKFRNALFEHPGTDARFLYLKLVGTTSNRDAVGARIAVEIDTPAGPRTIHRAVGSVSSFGGSPGRQEIGLADATAIRSVTIHWPASGTTQVFTDLPLDAFVRVTEGRKDFEVLDLIPLHFKTHS